MDIHVYSYTAPRVKDKIKIEVHERGDGSIGVFYFLNSPSIGVEVNILEKQSKKSIRKSPYFLKGFTREYCHCPLPTIEAFRNIYKCKQTSSALLDFDFFDRLYKSTKNPIKYEKKTSSELESSIKNEFKFPLSSFRAIFTPEDIDFVVKQFNDNGGCFVHYSIKNNKIYAKAYGQWQGFKSFMDDMLFSLQRKVILPDVEFVLNIGDYPSANRTTHLLDKPLVSWCKSVDYENQLLQSHRPSKSDITVSGRRWSYLNEDTTSWDDIMNLVGNGTSDILLPTYKLTRALIWGLNIESPLKTDLKTFANNGHWESREAKVLFRGRDSNDRRLQFVLQHNGTIDSSDNKWADVRISKNEGNYFPDEESRIRDANCPAQKVVRRKFEFFFRQKFQLSIDGTVAAYRLPALMAGGSVIFKQDSIYEEHFYNQLIRDVHYVPVKEDLSNVRKVWEYAINNDKKMKKIAENARKFSREWLSMEQVLCDHLNVLEAMSLREKFEPRILDGMLEFTDKKQETHGKKCDCKQFYDTAKQKGFIANIQQKPDARDEL